MPFPIPSARIVQLASVRPLENLLGKNGCCVRGRILAFELRETIMSVSLLLNQMGSHDPLGNNAMKQSSHLAW